MLVINLALIIAHGIRAGPKPCKTYWSASHKYRVWCEAAARRKCIFNAQQCGVAIYSRGNAIYLLSPKRSLLTSLKPDMSIALSAPVLLFLFLPALVPR